MKWLLSPCESTSIPFSLPSKDNLSSPYFLRIYLELFSLTLKSVALSSCDKFSMCLGNLSSISVHSLMKISLLCAYIFTFNFDILCLLETYLDSSISSNDNNLTIHGFDLYRADHPFNVKCRDFVSAMKIFFRLNK